MIYTGDVWGFICYLGDRAICNGPFMDLPESLNEETVRECCIARNGFAFNLFHGDEDCTECIGKRSYIANLTVNVMELGFFCGTSYWLSSVLTYTTQLLGG